MSNQRRPFKVLISLSGSVDDNKLNENGYSCPGSDGKALFKRLNHLIPPSYVPNIVLRAQGSKCKRVVRSPWQKGTKLAKMGHLDVRVLLLIC